MKKITNLLNIKYPILQGAMAWISESNLASAVSNSGGAGIIAAGGRDTTWLRDEIRKTKELTDKPFGVNIVLMDQSKDELIEVVKEEKVDFVTLGAGNPVPYIETIKLAGIKVICIVPNGKLAKRVEKAGADAIIVEGMEAGGHIGTQTTMALMSNVIGSVNIPVIVAGGITTGKAIASCLLMGADGVQLGSRYLLSTECLVHDNMKNAIIEAEDFHSVVTGYSRGHGVRSLKSDFTNVYLKMEAKGAPQNQLNSLATGTNRKAAVEGDIKNGAAMVGQSLNTLNKVQSCDEIMKELVSEVNNAFKIIPKL